VAVSVEAERQDDEHKPNDDTDEADPKAPVDGDVAKDEGASTEGGDAGDDKKEEG